MLPTTTLRARKRIELLNLGSPKARFPGISRRTGEKGRTTRLNARVRESALDFQIRRIPLFVRGGALGDLILTLPLLREIRNSYQYASTELWGIYPQAKLAAPAFADRVERLRCSRTRSLFSWPRGQMPPMLRSRLEAFDLAITLLSDPDMTIARNLATAGVKKVIGGSCRVRPGVHAVYSVSRRCSTSLD